MANRFLQIDEYISKTTQLIVGQFIFYYIISKFINHVYLVVTPGWSILYFWTFLTAGFVKLSFFDLVISSIIIHFAYKPLAVAWGFEPVIRFTIIVNCITYILVEIILLLLLVLSFNSSSVTSITAYGSGALLAGSLIAIKQSMPEHQISAILISFRAKYAPSIFVLFSFVVSLLGQSFISFVIVLCGTIVSWSYLRFFKETDGFLGDRSETFAFATFFPQQVRPYIKPVSSFVYNKVAVPVYCAITRSPTPQEYSSLPTTVFAADSVSSEGPTGIASYNDMADKSRYDRRLQEEEANRGRTASLDSNSQQSTAARSPSNDAERRRQKALQALDAHLSSKTTSTSSAQSPNLISTDDNENEKMEEQNKDDESLI